MTHPAARNRRRTLNVWGTSLLLVLLLGLVLYAAAEPAQALPDQTRQPLPVPVINPHSTEICMNSRLSYHGGWNSAGTEQMLANVLHATAQTPVTVGPLAIYAATAQNLYLYDAGSHSLTVHKAGDWRSDATAAFEVGVATANQIDAGAAMHVAQLESIALWTGTANQLASCPRASATTYANSNWDPADPIDIVVSFGLRSVPGFTPTLVAVSSDGSLPDPDTDGPVFLDNALADLAVDSTFAAEDLSHSDVSQLLWASYGCSNHTASGKGGLVCSSAVANYYLSRRIYHTGGDGVYRFHNRRPPGTDATTRDHRIELVTSGDTRPALRQQVARLPEAPSYFIICIGSTGAWPELEVGFAAMGAVLEASSMDLQGHLTTALSAAEQAGIRLATGIPSGDIPMAVVSLGRPLDASGADRRDQERDRLALSIENGMTSGGPMRIRFELPRDADVDLAVYDCLGRRVRNLIAQVQGKGAHAAVWDCRDGRGRPVLSGVYFCRLKAGALEKAEQLVVVR